MKTSESNDYNRGWANGFESGFLTALSFIAGEADMPSVAADMCKSHCFEIKDLEAYAQLEDSTKSDKLAMLKIIHELTEDGGK